MKMINCPLKVNTVPISSVDNPVTQLELVEINKASIKDIPLTVISGNNNCNVPKDISIKNEIINSPPCPILIFPKKFPMYDNSTNIKIKK